MWSISKRSANQLQTSSWLEKVKFMESCFIVLKVSVTCHKGSMSSDPCTGGMIKKQRIFTRDNEGKSLRRKGEAKMAKSHFRVWLKCHIYLR